MTTILPSPKGSITIQPAVPADGATVRALRLEALLKHADIFTADHDTSEAQTADLWTERIASEIAQHDGAIFIGSVEGAAIAMCGVTCGPSTKTHHSGKVWGVYVQEEWRGLHIAEAMVQACVAWARQHGLVVLKLSVLSTNTAAIRCYSRCGFALYGVEPKGLFVQGAFYDRVLMSRLL